jgi:hypothetical protein
MTEPFNGPCAPWDPIWGACTLPTSSPCATGDLVQAATEVLWNATAQQFGLCPVTVRPCRRDCYPGVWSGPRWFAIGQWSSYGGWPRSMWADTGWVDAACGGCAGGCSCTSLSEALLPAPVYDVTEVLLDGQVLAPSAYRVDDNRLLVRVDGGMWPACQDLALPATAAGTWQVSVRVGQPVPVLGRQAVGELACEMAKACAGEDCLLPANVVSLVRQGVSVQFPARDAASLAARGYFGGLFVQTFNPHKLPGRPAVYDVDGPGFRRAGT